MMYLDELTDNETKGKASEAGRKVSWESGLMGSHLGPVNDGQNDSGKVTASLSFYKFHKTSQLFIGFNIMF